MRRSRAGLVPTSGSRWRPRMRTLTRRRARQSGLTLWRQIAETLRQDIGGTDYPPGARLPTEAELRPASASIATPCAARWKNCRAAA